VALCGYHENMKVLICVREKKTYRNVKKKNVLLNLKAEYQEDQQVRKVLHTMCCHRTQEFITIITTAHH
jgi:hypothetical protein